MSLVNFLLSSHCTLDKDILPGDIMKLRVVHPVHEEICTNMSLWGCRHAVAELRFEAPYCLVT